MGECAAAKPDGYTLGTMSSTSYLVALQGRALPFDPIDGFSYVSYIGENLIGIAVRADSPWQTLADLVAAAKARGYTYLAVTDHSRSSAIAGGLSTERLLQHAENVRRLSAQLHGFRLLAGTECDILPDGSLDYPDEVLAQLDWVVASIHAAQHQDRANSHAYGGYKGWRNLSCTIDTPAEDCPQ